MDMNKVACFLVLFILGCLLPAFPALAWEGMVRAVHDGDTVTLAPGGACNSSLSIRLYGIDAPELGQAGGPESREALARILPPESLVEVVPLGQDRYNRVVALLIRKGKNVNARMLESGHAWLFKRYCRAKFCREWARMEKSARSARRGLWADEAAVPPWQWRKQRRVKP